MAPSRRAVLLGGLALAGTGVLGGCSSGAPSDAVSGSFRSRYRRAETGWTILYPPGHRRRGLPVLIALHGRGGNHTSTYSELHLDSYLATAVQNGTRPFAIASADGGDADYWHPRAHTDPAGMIVHEFLPLLARHGLDVRRVGLFGWSMGGYGALYLALWHRLDRLRGIALRIDCGASDGFAPITRDLRRELAPPRPAGGIEPGGHDDSYWRSQALAQLEWFGRQIG